jgi:tRNA U54 and U55 pseudouridine synthase Pus10
MIIDGVEYENVFELDYFSPIEKCFICQKEIKKEEKCFDEVDILLSSIDISSTPLQICTNCVSSPEEAEEKVIPLLKILYGGKIEVKRYRLCDKYERIFYY